jgi:hypothetical protein
MMQPTLHYIWTDYVGLKNIPWVFYFTEHRIHGCVSLVAYFKWIDLSILELNIAILHCMFSEIKNAVYISILYNIVNMLDITFVKFNQNHNQ